jgi:DNA-binding transcriptional LysR family regulator
VEGRNSSATAEAVRAGELDAAIVALPVDESGLDVRPIFSSEVFCVSADPSHVAAPVTIEQVCQRPFILYDASSHGQDPTRIQMESRAQTLGLRIAAHVEVEAVETALDLAARGIADTYVAQALVATIDPLLHAARFDPPLVDTFALITRAGSRLPRPIADFLDQMTTHLVALAKKSEAAAAAISKAD